MKGGDGTASWTNPGASYRASNAASANSLTVLCGLPEEPVLATFSQYIVHGGGAVYNEDANIAIGVNSTTVKSGMVGRSDLAGTGSGTSTNLGAQAHARHLIPTSLGINTINALERAVAGTASTFNGTEDHMGLFAEWRG